MLTYSHFRAKMDIYQFGKHLILFFLDKSYAVF